MKYIGNAFSLQMLDICEETTVLVTPVEQKELPADLVSVVGHPDTAKVLGVDFNRISLKLKQGDILYVAQLQGGRLPEGCITLPEGFTFKFYKVELK